MNTVQKIATGIIGVGLATTLVLPGRQTPKVIDAVRKLFTNSLSVAMGNKR